MLKGFHMAIMFSIKLVIIPALPAAPFAESSKREACRIVLDYSCYERFWIFAVAFDATELLLETSYTEVAQSRMHKLAFGAGL
jgi:hypothetical protein